MLALSSVGLGAVCLRTVGPSSIGHQCADTEHTTEPTIRLGPPQQRIERLLDVHVHGDPRAKHARADDERRAGALDGPVADAEEEPGDLEGLGGLGRAGQQLGRVAEREAVGVCRHADETLPRHDRDIQRAALCDEPTGGNEPACPNHAHTWDPQLHGS